MKKPKINQHAGKSGFNLDRPMNGVCDCNRWMVER